MVLHSMCRFKSMIKKISCILIAAMVACVGLAVLHVPDVEAADGCASGKSKRVSGVDILSGATFTCKASTCRTIGQKGSYMDGGLPPSAYYGFTVVSGTAPSSACTSGITWQ